jgi:hypothetical protein
MNITMVDFMKIVTTPMCEEILKMVGIENYLINKNPDIEEADFAVVLSETETKIDSLKLKLNTFTQIHESAFNLGKILNLDHFDENFKEKLSRNLSKISPWANPKQKKILRKKNRNIRVKVYSQFLKDIIEDMGYITVEKNPDFVIFPDYMEDHFENNLDDMGNIENPKKMKNNHDGEIAIKYLKIPSHGDVPTNPLERALMRYNFLEEELCMKL